MSELPPCDICGAPAFAIAPGQEPVHDLFLLNRGVATRAWCLRHWMEKFG